LPGVRPDNFHQQSFGIDKRITQRAVIKKPLFTMDWFRMR
jgi:hypothetical protein